MADNQALKDAVEEYVKLHKQLTAANKELSVFRKQKAELGQVIITYLNSQEIDRIKKGDTLLVKKESTRQASMSRDHVMTALRSAGVDAEKVMKDIDSLRDKKTKNTLSCKIAK